MRTVAIGRASIFGLPKLYHWRAAAATEYYGKARFDHRGWRGHGWRADRRNRFRAMARFGYPVRTVTSGGIMEIGSIDIIAAILAQGALQKTTTLTPAAATEAVAAYLKIRAELVRQIRAEMVKEVEAVASSGSPILDRSRRVRTP
jgi:hypothetical protein